MCNHLSIIVFGSVVYVQSVHKCVYVLTYLSVLSDILTD